jgi:hypothetical protein
LAFSGPSLSLSLSLLAPQLLDVHWLLLCWLWLLLLALPWLLWEPGGA